MQKRLNCNSCCSYAAACAFCISTCQYSGVYCKYAIVVYLFCYLMIQSNSGEFEIVDTAY